jgi:predicted DNA-binding protein
MAAPKNRGYHESRPSGKPVPVRFPEEVVERVRQVSESLGISFADTVRLATRIGLEDLKRVDYDLAQLVVDAAHKRPPVL